MLNIENQKKSVGLIPSNQKIFHIIGIGGIGMSAIAFILHEHELFVQGSDLNFSENIEKLKEKNIQCFIGKHDKKNISNADIIIYSTAVPQTNEEILEAKKLGKIVLSRAEILSYIIYTSYNIAISGMHGKTTTSSMMALIFEFAKIKHLSMIGGIMEFNKSNYIVHKNFEWCVIEADESDDTFIKIPSSISVITNISPEHLDYHLTFENITRKFKKFIEIVPFFGFSLICTEDSQMIDFVSEIKNEFRFKKILTYAVEDFLEKKNNLEFFNYLAKNIFIHDLNKMTFDVFCNSIFLGNFELNIFGKFNISNALAAIAVSNEIGVKLHSIQQALKNFKTTKRRFDILGEISENILIVDDYAHHPKEINANIETAKILAEKKGGRLIIVLQPHRYSRVQKLFDSFVESKICEVDFALILPIYSAGEAEIQGISSENLTEKIIEFSKNSEKSKNNFIKFFKSFDELSSFLNQNKKKNDLIIFMGAGDVSKMAYDFFESCL